MNNFLKFMLKCLWHASNYVFSTGTASAKREEPFATLGIIGFALLTTSFLLLSWFIVKFDYLPLRIIVSIFISLIVATIYFLIVYLFVI